MDRDKALQELQRVAHELSSRTMSRSTFDKHADIASATIEATFGSWNEAIIAAGLTPLPQGGLPRSDQRREERLGTSPRSSLQAITDADLLDELLRLARELGKRPSGNQVSAKGKFGRDVYQKRWGSLEAAYAAAMTFQSASTKDGPE